MKKILNNRIFQLSLVMAIGLFFGWLIFKGDKTEKHELTVEVNQTTWTCSMHPQIRQDEPGNCPICGMELIPVSKQNGQQEHSSPFVYSMSPEAVALANIQTAKVMYMLPEHEIYLTGKIAVNEQKLAVITANFSGRIERLFVDYTGQTLTKGQKLATIYSPELVTAQKELLEAAKSKDINPALFNAAREKLSLWKITENQINAIAESGTIATELDVFADISGVVLKREVSKGDYISKGNVLFEIADLSSVWVIYDAYETDIPWLKLGDKVSFTLSSLPGKEYLSTITFIDPLINSQTRTVSVRTEVSNPGMMLKPEMFVNAKVKTRISINDKSLLIPKTSILWTGKRSVIYVKVPDSEFPAYEMREIILGPPAGAFYLVESGLKEGEEIVINGVFAIDAAAQLSGNYSMMNRPVSKRIAVPEKFQSQLMDLNIKYFDLKNALVESDFAKSKKTTEKLLQSLQSADMKLLERKAHELWMEQEIPLRKAIISLSKAKNIEEQREHFSAISLAIIEIAELFSLTIEPVYLAYCPMAFGDKGAYWLSEFEEIKNPYFGDAMLKCGEVKKKISAADNYQETSPEKPPAGHQH